MHIKPLPPLKSLVAFEAASRYLSFTQAADELNVTQGAISRQVRHLEEYLGQPLFIREKRRLILTPVGAEYYGKIQQSLHQISRATSDVATWKDDEQVTVFTSNAMASFWLLPRFTDFQDQYPKIDLRILAIDSINSIHSSEFDIALFYCRRPPQGLEISPLFSETVFPVCSPAYLEKHPEIKTAEDLVKGTLLCLDVNEEWLTWQDWFNESGIDYSPADTRRLNINNYPLVVQSALNGQGLALAWAHLVDDYLASGWLVRPIDTTVTTASQFYMLEPQQPLKTKSGLKYFREWLLKVVESEAASKRDLLSNSAS